MGSEFLRVPEGWAVKPLIDCTEDGIISYGIVQPGSHDEDGIPVLRVNNFSGNSLDTTNVLKVSPEIEKKFARTRLKGGEVLLTLVGSTGQSVVAPTSLSGWNVPRAIAVIRPEANVGSEWINICLQTDATKSFLDARANTTVQKTLNLQDVKQIPILVPPERVKERIEKFAVALNQKIALNRQINTTLESMAQALFKSWFVDFDPVIDNALATGNEIPDELAARAARREALRQQTNKTTEATDAVSVEQPLPETGLSDQRLPSEIQQLFPDRFVLTEDMGWVPEGWEVRPLSEALYINPKVSIKKGAEATYVDMKALPTSGFMIDEAIKKEFSGGAKFKNRDVLLARITPCLENGKTGLVDFLSDDEAGFGSTEFIVLREKGSITMPFIASLSRHPEFRNHCVLNMVGSSGRQRVQNSCFDSYFVSTPTDSELLELFDQVCYPYFTKMAKCRDEARNLADLRDSLLPKLLSGQITIPDAEQQLAEVL